jgi:hypothetical protein
MTADDFEEAKNSGIKFAIVAAWLKSTLSQGPRLKVEIQQEALQLGISVNMLRNVRAALKVKPSKLGYQGGTTWRLPPDAEPDGDAEAGATTGAADEAFDAAGKEIEPEPIKIGGSPTRLEETGGNCNLEGCAAPPQD